MLCHHIYTTLGVSSESLQPLVLLKKCLISLHTSPAISGRLTHQQPERTFAFMTWKPFCFQPPAHHVNSTHVLYVINQGGIQSDWSDIAKQKRVTQLRCWVAKITHLSLGETFFRLRRNVDSDLTWLDSGPIRPMIGPLIATDCPCYQSMLFD